MASVLCPTCRIPIVEMIHLDELRTMAAGSRMADAINAQLAKLRRRTHSKTSRKQR